MLFKKMLPVFPSNVSRWYRVFNRCYLIIIWRAGATDPRKPLSKYLDADKETYRLKQIATAFLHYKESHKAIKMSLKAYYTVLICVSVPMRGVYKWVQVSVEVKSVRCPGVTEVGRCCGWVLGTCCPTQLVLLTTELSLCLLHSPSCTLLHPPPTEK